MWYCHEVRLIMSSSEVGANPCCTVPCRDAPPDGTHASIVNEGAPLMKESKVPHPVCASCNSSFVEKVRFSLAPSLGA